MDGLKLAQSFPPHPKSYTRLSEDQTAFSDRPATGSYWLGKHACSRCRFTIGLHPLIRNY